MRLRVATLAVLAACGPAVDVPSEDGTAGETSTGTTPTPNPTSTPPDPATSASPTTASTSTTDDSTSSDGTGDDFPGFLPAPDVPPEDCDIWGQNCPEGEKCTAWADDGGSAWNANRCVPVADNPVGPGDTCTVEGIGTSGIDNCDATSMCMPDIGANTGTCIAFCTGSPDDPMCGGAEICVISNWDALVLCYESCDPVAQDCRREGWACYPVDDGAVCAPEGENPGAHGTKCEMLATCNPGLVCVQAGAVAGCPDDPCCAAYCDTEEVGADEGCPGYDDGERCLPFYPEGEAPDGLEHVGICIIP